MSDDYKWFLKYMGIILLGGLVAIVMGFIFAILDTDLDYNNCECFGTDKMPCMWDMSAFQSICSHAEQLIEM